MAVTIQLRGRQIFLKNVEKYRKKQGRKLEEALHASALVVQNDARRSILKGPKTGRIYPRGKRSSHQASAPGEAPASDTGTLVRNILAEMDPRKLFVRIIAKTKYSLFLEEGTKKMKPRPFLRPALERNLRKITAIFQAKLREL